jgi:aminoglycoside phosphotransferase (APT) family kinase protein
MPDTPPSAAALAEAARLAGPAAAVQTVQPLAGGTHARTVLIRTVNPETEMVLREFPPGDDAASQEVRVLRSLGGLDGLAPKLLASDSSDFMSGGSWLLISRLPGTADITPRHPAIQAEELGRALARIHQTPPGRLTGLSSVFDRPGGSLAGVSGPAAGVLAAHWQSMRSATSVLVHYDFWSGNVVWDGAVLTGVVDWSGGSLGPPGFDVGWCRLDLYLLHGQDVADVFLAAYDAASATAIPAPQLWDLWAVARSHQMVETWVPNYRDLGRTDLTATELRRRHTAWTEQVLARTAGIALR